MGTKCLKTSPNFDLFPIGIDFGMAGNVKEHGMAALAGIRRPLGKPRMVGVPLMSKDAPGLPHGGGQFISPGAGTGDGNGIDMIENKGYLHPMAGLKQPSEKIGFVVELIQENRGCSTGRFTFRQLNRGYAKTFGGDADQQVPGRRLRSCFPVDGQYFVKIPAKGRDQPVAEFRFR